MKKITVSDIIFLILSLILFFGTKFAFHACPAKADGSWMTCHWAELVVVGLGAVFVLLSVARFFVEPKIKAGVSLSFIPLSVLTIFVPGVLVNLCMMKDMRCHTTLRPAVIVFGALIAVLSLVDFIILLKNAKKVG